MVRTRRKQKEIEARCRYAVDTYLSKKRNEAKENINRSFRLEAMAVRQENEERMEYLHNADLRQSDTVDHAKHSLEQIVQLGKHRSSRPRRVVEMPTIDSVPNYDAWVPVRSSLWVGADLEWTKDLLYMPFFGDEFQEKQKSIDLCKEMQDDIEQAAEFQVSDGEVDEDGKMCEPRNDQEWRKYDSLAQLRWRAGCRSAIRHILAEYGKEDEAVYEAMANGLGIDSVDRVRALAKVAVERKRSETSKIEERYKRHKLRLGTRQSTNRGSTETEMSQPDELMLVTHKYFCATCQVFLCRQHENNTVMPVHPIRDIYVENRIHLLRASQAPKCTGGCYLNLDKDEIMEYQGEPWVSDELSILRECIPVFQHDACSLAIAIGTRTCLEVHSKLQEPEEQRMLKESVAKWNSPRKVDSHTSDDGATKRAESHSQGDGGNGSSEGSTTSPNGQKKAKKTISAGNHEFVPCFHRGKCTIQNCICIQRELKCQSTCGCNNVRFCEDDAKGMTYYVDTKGRPKNKHGNGRCDNRMPGCGCNSGHCNTESCECWRTDHACDPDFCIACDCSTLHADAALRCRNVAVLRAKHKRTIIGQSRTHGMGLFAGEQLEPGDLVGTYDGQVLETDMADLIGRIYDAKDHTFFFDITDNLVVDGGVLGTKTKFINHAPKGSRLENCVSKLVRVKGDANIALFAKRRILPGEELFFDYQFTNIVPEWAKVDPAQHVDAN